MSEYVLDPAVAAKWFIPNAQEAHVVESRVLLDRLAKGHDRAHVPEIFPWEFAAWLARFGADANLNAEAAWQAVRALPLQIHTLTRELSAHAFLAARRHQVDFYTAAYLALAETLIVPYLSADDALVARLAGSARISGLAGANS